MRVRDPRLPPPRIDPPTLGPLRAKVLAAKNPPGALEGKSFGELRVLLVEPTATDGLLMQALLDEGLEVI